MTSLSPHGTYPTCVADAFFPNPLEIQNRFHVPAVSATGSGLRDWDLTPEAVRDICSVWVKAACHVGISTQDALSFQLRCSLLPHGRGPHKLVSLWPHRRLQEDIRMTAAAARRKAPAGVRFPRLPVHRQNHLSQGFRWGTGSLQNRLWKNKSDPSSSRFHSGSAKVSSSSAWNECRTTYIHGLPVASATTGHLNLRSAWRMERASTGHGPRLHGRTRMVLGYRQKPGEPVGSVNIPWLHSQWSHMEGAEQTAWTSVSLLYGQGK